MCQTLQTSLSFFTHVDVVTFPRTLTVSTYLPANGRKAQNKTLSQIKQHVAKTACFYLTVHSVSILVRAISQRNAVLPYIYKVFFILRRYTLRTGSMVDNKHNLLYRNCVGIHLCFFNIKKLNFSSHLQKWQIGALRNCYRPIHHTDPSLFQSKRNTE